MLSNYKKRLRLMGVLVFVGMGYAAYSLPKKHRSSTSESLSENDQKPLQIKKEQRSSLSVEPTNACRPDRTGDSMLFLVNKKPKHILEADYNPEDKVELEEAFTAPGRKILLRKDAAKAITNLLLAAREQADLDMRVLSGFRSYKTQGRVFRSKVAKIGEVKARFLSAVPGRSQHQLGTAVDITTDGLGWKLSPKLEKVAEGKWLERQAHTFGFVMSYPKGQHKLTGYSYEPWHYRYVGLGAASEMKSKGIPLEEYLQRCLTCDPELLCFD